MSTLASTASRPKKISWFLWHLCEMTIAMMAGMVAFGVLLGSLLAAAGSTLLDARIAQPELTVLGMAAAMSVPMVAWMRRGGHGWRSAAEMSAAMFVPALVLIVCYRLGAVAAESICPLACLTMIPAMAVAMLFRLDEYMGHRPGGEAVRAR